MNRRLEQKQAFDARYGEPRTLDELATTVIQAASDFADSKSPGCRVVGLQWDVQHRLVSNSNYSPIDGFTNFAGRDDRLPTNYPGWYGRLWIRYNQPPGGFGSDPVKQCFVHTGTGGFGSYDGPWDRLAHVQYKNRNRFDYPKPEFYSWDFRFFESDWPQLSEAKARSDVWHALGGEDKFSQHRFLWEDPDVRQKDQEFMQRVKDSEFVEFHA